MYCKLENKTDTVKKFTFSHAISIFISRLKKKKCKSFSKENDEKKM